MKEYFVQFCAECGEGEPLHRGLLLCNHLQRLPCLHPRVWKTMFVKFISIYLLSLERCGRQLSCFRRCTTQPTCPADESDFMVVVDLTRLATVVPVQIGSDVWPFQGWAGGGDQHGRARGGSEGGVHCTGSSGYQCSLRFFFKCFIWLNVLAACYSI